jgi:hypothetical protein
MGLHPANGLDRLRGAPGNRADREPTLGEHGGKRVKEYCVIVAEY